MNGITLPFGKHKGQPLPEVPTDYLQWWLATIEKQSAGLKGALVAEVERRGATPPPAPVRTASAPLPCQRCRVVDVRHTWQEDRLGRKRIRRTCKRCGAWMGCAPTVEPFVSEANASASPTAVLDVLLMAEAEGVRLVSDGAAADLAPGDWRRASPQLRDRLQQCRHLLGSMLGRNGTA